ncbi:exopolysaccharide biosynthesis protein [Paenibacillus sp. FSL H8-0548]|uniref:phosphodiester glycosidase family protein n=1 Tax=Paenibacillus sp. FSL H8-0548 TaxID=1920422 RepID=UPI00096C6965|nr:phosphodiester glycosidase family protein [Paenibacillus sp. FSL H8-0548]OMF24380.1 exopolysaccharide biosynthesis protein [Paenibacillus sp. FSL H8-0548]
MNLTVKALNRTALLACAPFIGMMIWLLLSDTVIQLSNEAFPKPVTEQAKPPEADIMPAAKGLELAQQTASQTRESIQKQIKLYHETNEDMAKISSIAAAQAKRPLLIYDRNITSKLGKVSETIESDKLRAQLFYIKAENFSAYALKVKLKSADAMTMTLGEDELGKAETTLAAVKRNNAVAGVNAGGFADGGGKRYPLSTTIVDGSYATGFEPPHANLFFVGLNDQNELIGGKFATKEQLNAKKPKFGASFVPVLLRGEAPQPIPAKWQTSPKRAPRTVIANYKDDQLLFLVADGYDETGSSGATLEEMQLLLQRYGAVDGYNLDGGGSSSLIFNGRVINKPSDGNLRKLPTHFLFFK